MGEGNYFDKLRKRWGLTSLFQVIIVLIVFGLTGMTVVLLRKSLFQWLGFDDQTDWWVKTITYLLFIFPAYQVLILVYGAIFGQFQFFWEKEKKLVQGMGRIFSRVKGKNS